MTTRELQPTNNQKSFYGKAIVKTNDDGTEVLFSYGVLIRSNDKIDMKEAEKNG